MRGELVDPVNNAAFTGLMLTITPTTRFKLRQREFITVLSSRTQQYPLRPSRAHRQMPASHCQLLATFAIRKTFFVAIATHHGRKRKLRATSTGSFAPTT